MYGPSHSEKRYAALPQPQKPSFSFERKIYQAIELARFNHPIPDQPQHHPHQHVIPTYGATVQHAKPKDTSQRLSPSKKKYIQEVIGTFLYYGRAVDSTMLTALLAIASAHAKPTEETMLAANNSLTTQPHTKTPSSPTRQVTWS